MLVFFSSRSSCSLSHAAITTAAFAFAICFASASASSLLQPVRNNILVTNLIKPARKNSARARQPCRLALSSARVRPPLIDFFYFPSTFISFILGPQFGGKSCSKGAVVQSALRPTSHHLLNIVES